MNRDDSFLKRRVRTELIKEADKTRELYMSLAKELIAGGAPMPIVAVARCLASASPWVLRTVCLVGEGNKVIVSLCDPNEGGLSPTPWLSVNLKELDIYPANVKATAPDLADYILSFNLGEDHNASHLNIVGELLLSITNYPDFGHDGRIEHIKPTHTFTFYGGGFQWDITIEMLRYKDIVASWETTYGLRTGG